MSAPVPYIVGLVVALGFVLGAGPSFSREPGVSGGEPAARSERAVHRPPRAVDATPVPGRPLTRAGERSYVESIDPAAWLARFGEVEKRERGEQR